MQTKVKGGPDALDVAVGARIRIRRRQLGLSQTALADGIGVTFQQVQKYEHGRNRVSASMLVRTAEVLQTTVAALVAEDGGEPVEPVVAAQLSTPGAIELLRAFSEMPSASDRNALLTMTQRLAEGRPVALGGTSEQRRPA